VTRVHWTRRAERQFDALSPELRRAIIRTLHMIEQDAPVFPYRDDPRRFYRPIAGHRGWYVVLRERADGSYRFNRIRHTIYET
jgi:hypothetical protein